MTSRLSNPPLIHVVAGVVLWGDRVVVTQRPHGKSGAGLWEFPGGKVESSDASPQQALARELWEELRLSVDPAQMRPFMRYTPEHQEGLPYLLEQSSLDLDFYVLTAPSMTLQPQEGQGYVWATYDQLSTMPLLPTNRDVLDGVKALLAQRYGVRVYFEDTDAGGVVYYANYLKYAERARTEWLRRLGIDHAAMVDHEDRSFVVRHCAITYLKPARLDDCLWVDTTVTATTGAQVILQQRIFRGSTLLAEVDVHLAVMMISTGKPCRLPASLIKILKKALEMA